MKLGLLTLGLFVLALALAGCDVTLDDKGFDMHDPVRQAAATATIAAVQAQDKNAQVEIAIKQAVAAQEIEATRTAMQAELAHKMIVATVEAGAQAQAIETQSQAQTQVTVALGQAGYIAILAIGVGLAIAAIILATGHSVASVKQAVLAANYVQIGVESRTLLPPPLIITVDGYLIDTRTGERARLRDAVGVSQLRLAATTHSTETAQLALTEIEIAKTTKSDKAADALMVAAGNVPMLQVGTSADEDGAYRQ